MCNFESKMCNFESKMCNFESKMCNFESKMCNFESKMCNFESKMYNFEPKMYNFEPKMYNFEPKMCRLLKNRISTKFIFDLVNLHKLLICWRITVVRAVKEVFKYVGKFWCAYNSTYRSQNDIAVIIGVPFVDSAAISAYSKNAWPASNCVVSMIMSIK
uniref:Uncharacterized protein n=1 Tax=Strigamia maritima TaxID=126957 RepID=T1JIW6_STRMM